MRTVHRLLVKDDLRARMRSNERPGDPGGPGPRRGGGPARAPGADRGAGHALTRDSVRAELSDLASERARSSILSAIPTALASSTSLPTGLKPSAVSTSKSHTSATASLVKSTGLPVACCLIALKTCSFEARVASLETTI